MKNSKTFLCILALFFVLISCGQKQQSSSTETSKPSEVMQVDDLLSNAETLVGETVVVDGVCTHICRHGGKKLFLMGSDDTKTIRVEQAVILAVSVGNSKQHCGVKGVLMEQRIDEAYLVNWETKLADQTEKHGVMRADVLPSKAQNEKSANTEQERVTISVNA